MREFVFFDKNDVEKKDPKRKVRFVISNIRQLNDVVENLRKITIFVDVTTLTDKFIEELDKVTKGHSGKTSLHFNIYDPDMGISVNMHSRKKSIMFNDELRNFLESNKLEYTLE